MVTGILPKKGYIKIVWINRLQLFIIHMKDGDPFYPPVRRIPTGLSFCVGRWMVHCGWFPK